MVSTLCETQLLFSRQSIEIYRKLKQNNEELAGFENMSQVWLLIIKKALFEKEYERALKEVEVYLSGIQSTQRTSSIFLRRKI